VSDQSPSIDFSSRPPGAAAFVEFHARHKLLLMAHAPHLVRTAGRLVAQAGRADLEGLWSNYVTAVMPALAQPPTRGGHVNVLQHAAGYFRAMASAEDRRALRAAIEAFAAGSGPLDEPIRLLRLLAERHAVTYIARQVYLQRTWRHDG
jgi:uncharacterized protein YbgA (DUF1722 family)